VQIGKADEPFTRISRASADRIEVRGRDLAADLMGRLTFTEYFHLLLTGREPTDDERFFLDLLLVAIAEHGLVPSNVAARMTLAADPGFLQGAVAAGILGAGTVILGAARGRGRPAAGCGCPCRRPEVRGGGTAPARLRASAPPPRRPTRRADPRARERAGSRGTASRPGPQPARRGR